MPTEELAKEMRSALDTVLSAVASAPAAAGASAAGAGTAGADAGAGTGAGAAGAGGAPSFFKADVFSGSMPGFILYSLRKA